MRKLICTMLFHSKESDSLVGKSPTINIIAYNYSNQFQ